MNLDELRSVQAKERRKDSLQHLRDAFYDDVAAYVNDLRAARDHRADQVSNPFSDDDVRRMSDELETAEEVAEALYERRVGKVVKLASFAAADMPVETEGMTTEERALFDDLVERIEANKATVLNTLAGEVPSETDGADGTTGTNTSSDTDPEADVNPDAATNAHGGTAAAEPDRSVERGPAAEPDPSENADPDAPSAPGGDVLAGAMGAETDSASEQEDGRGVGNDRTATADTVPDGGATADRAGGGTATPADDTADNDGPTPVEPEPAPPGAPGTNGSTANATSAHEPADGANSGEGRDSASSGGGDRSTDTERETVRITRDVGAILGVDEREYELTSEDIVDLPTANAEPLVQRDAAERID